MIRDTVAHNLQDGDATAEEDKSADGDATVEEDKSAAPVLAEKDVKSDDTSTSKSAAGEEDPVVDVGSESGSSKKQSLR